MPNTFKPKRSNTPSSVPTTGNLADGELAVNSADKIIYLRDGGSIVEVANYSTGTGGESYWIQNDVGIHTLSNVGIGTTNPTAKLDVLGDVKISGITTSNVFVSSGGIYSAPSETKSDAAFVMGQNDAIYTVDSNEFLRVLIEKQSGTINIGQFGTAFINGIELRPGGSGSVKLHHGGSGDNVKIQTTGVGATVFGDLEVSGNIGIGTDTPTAKLDVLGNLNVTGNINSAGIITASNLTEYKILDDISSQFNGSTTQFTISSSSTNFLNSEITSAARLLISVGGVVQQPDPTQTNGYYISGGTDISTDPIKINFVEAPKAGQLFFGVAYGLTISPTSSFVTSEESIAYSIVFGV